MAVKRCPYCKAIIDEGAEYCTNCGTKLLFPEDEAIQEEIPGEMLTHDDFPGEDEESEEEADKKKRVNEAPEEEQVTEKEEDKEEEALPSLPKKTKSKRRRSVSKTRNVTPAETEDASGEVVVDESAEDIEPEPEEAEEVIDVRDEFKIATRRGKTEDLPDGFAETLEEAKAKIEETAAEEVAEKAIEEEIPMDEAGKVYDQTAAEMQREPLEEVSEIKDPASEEPLREPSRFEAGIVQTNDIEDIVDDAEKEKKEIDEFIYSVKKERESGIKVDETGELPPWAEAMEGTTPPPMPPTDEIELQEEEASEEIGDAPEDVEKWEAENVPQPEDELETAPEAGPEKEQEQRQEPPIEKGPGYDTSSAFPETVSVDQKTDQKGLPFRGDTEEEPLKGRPVQAEAFPKDSYQEEVHEDEIIPDSYIEEEVEEAAVQTETPRSFKIRPRRRTTPIPFLDWIKARIFDVFFIAALWFITLWVASQVLEISVIELIATSSSLTLMFLGILLALYFFFFLFFLGETLGNYLFSQDE